jgi:hypothetical protein
MNTAGWLLLLLAAADPGPASAGEETPGRMKPDWVRGVESVLAADEELLGHHRGYLGRLETDPELARAEESAWNLKSITRFREAEADFDETLQKNAALQVRFDGFYGELLRNPDLRASVDMLQRTLFGQDRAGDGLAEALDWFKAHPDDALRFFRNPSHLTPTPETVFPLLDYFRDHPELLEELEERFQNLTGHTDLWTEILPWWQGIRKLEAEDAEAWRRLSSHFMGHTNRFWIWHQYQLQLARDTQTRSWIRWWHRRIRREKQLAVQYIPYLRWLRDHPDLRRKTEARWQEKNGDPETWPPKTAPPRLQWLPEKRAGDSRRSFRREDHMPAMPRPEKTAIQRPAMPARPAMPTRPVRPPKPAKPERPAPESASPLRR